jgi:GH15 family glucan-1,4-alpha-glucosidase
VHKLLAVNDFVFRYQHDEFQEKENSFVLCTFWLITCLYKIGSKKKAKDILTKVLSNSNDLKIFSEEIDPQTGEYFGNYPQAFSHIGLINCILSLEE